MGVTIGHGNTKISGLAIDTQALSTFISFDADNRKMSVRSVGLKRSSSSIMVAPEASSRVNCENTLCCRNWDSEKTKLEIVGQSKNHNQYLDSENKLAIEVFPEANHRICSPELFPQKPRSDLDAASVKLQKVYKSYRTRRNLADCAVVVEELWWKALDFASLKQSSLSFLDSEKPELPLSRWARGRTKAAKVGKGLSKSDNAQKLALQHWLEAIDPCHRYGHNLHLYYDVWCKSESTQPFFYWLDIGGGKEVNLERCPRNTLQNQSIKYLGPNEREAYEVIVENGKLVYKQSNLLVNTEEGSKWIFVLCTLSTLYVGKKNKGKFQHSSFLAGGAIKSAGRLVVKEGILKAIWPYSGHNLPTEENFRAFVNFLDDNNLDLTNVKRCAIDDDQYPSFKRPKYEPEKNVQKIIETEECSSDSEEDDPAKRSKEVPMLNLDVKLDEEVYDEMGGCLPCNWTTGTGPRIGCVRDYPTSLQCRALEQVNLSPKRNSAVGGFKQPIPSPRPGPGVRLSPRLAFMGIPGPKPPLHFPKQR